MICVRTGLRMILSAGPDMEIVGEACNEGGSLFAPSVTRRLIEELTHRSDPRPHPSLDRLTEREVDVLRQVARAMSNTEIATTLFVTENTVKTHIARVLRKLGIRDRVQAVVVAYESGLVIPSAEPDP